MHQWYALHTKPHKEHQVEALLRARGIENYFPTYSAPRRRGRSATRAFFPRYLFVHTDMDQVGLWSLHYMPGVHGVVMFGSEPARVHDVIIEALRTRVAQFDPSGGSARGMVDAQGSPIEPGDRVTVALGAFADLEAVFDSRLTPAGRVRVLIRLLERWNKVEVDAEKVQKARGLPRQIHPRVR
jgi:transcription antitermination factor NusG